MGAIGGGNIALVKGGILLYNQNSTASIIMVLK